MTVLTNIELGGNRLDAQVLARMTRLEVRETDRDPTMAIVRFGLAQLPSGEMFPLDNDVFAPATRIAVDLAPPGGRTTRILDGFVTHVRPHFESVEANCYLEVVAMDAGALMAIGDHAEAYPDATDSEAATRVFSRYSLANGNITSTNARHDKDIQLLVQRESDWAFVQRLARRNGFRCYLEHDAGRSQVVAHFAPISTSSPQADLTILRAGSNLKWIDVQHPYAVPVRGRAFAIEPIAKRLVQASGTRITEPLGGDPAATATDRGLDAARATARERWARDPQPSSASITTEANAVTDALELCIEARGELDPALYRGLLRARRTVLLKGVGTRLAGSWYVSSVRTTLDTGVLTQTFVLQRNAIAPSGGERFGTTAEEADA
ncbi:MAG: contractile injection system protein, VgrG/Pvc8 family [Kofleriaceae bacterium]